MTTPILIDTSCLLAMLDRDSNHHAATIAVIRDSSYERIIPGPVLPELSYLLTKRLGHSALRHFIMGISVEKPRIEALIQTDYTRLAAVLHEYADMRLDFADASIMAIAERLNIQHILTLDRRDFHVLRPQHCAYFELLP